MYWRKDLATHIDQHNGPVGGAIVMPVVIGTKSATFEQTILVPPHANFEVKGLILFATDDVDASPSAYWTIDLIQYDDEQRTYEIFTHDGSTKGITGGEPLLLPLSQNASAPLEAGRPVVLRGTKTGSPVSLNDLFAQLVVRLS